MDYAQLIEHDSDIVDKIMYKIEDNEDIDIDLFSDTYSTNLFRGDIIFKLFDNLQWITLTLGNGSTGTYTFSFRYLLNMISKSYSLQKILIKGQWLYHQQFPGLKASVMDSQSRHKITSMFDQHQYDIKDREGFEITIKS